MAPTNAPTNHTTVQLFYFAFIIVGLWHSELLFKKENLKAKWQHTRLNLWFILTAVSVQLPLTVLLVKVTEWTAHHHFGILYRIPFTNYTVVKVFVGILLLDFFEYFYHFTMHRVGYLWHFHLVHHSDTKLDVSTTVREHPIETFVRVSIMILVVYITGVPILILIIRQFIQSLFNISSHTSISLPKNAEKILGQVFITPGLHKVHHHHELPYTDCNYGDILCIWDRLFGTYAKLEPGEIVYGLDVTAGEELDNFATLVNYPFKLKKKVRLQYKESLILDKNANKVFKSEF